MREDAQTAYKDMNNKLIANGNDKRNCRIEWARQRASLKERKESKHADGESNQTQKVIRKVEKDPNAIKTVVITGLPKNITQKDIYKKVKKITNVLEIHLRDDDDEVNETIANVLLESNEEANKVVKKLHGHIFKSKLINVSLLKKLENVKSGKGKISRKSRLIVRNLNFNINEDDLKSNFIKFGNIYSINLPKAKMNDGSLINKGFGFIWFTFYNDAKNALDNLNGKPLNLFSQNLELATKGGSKKMSKKIFKDIETRPIAVDWALSKDKWDNEINKKDGDENMDEGNNDEDKKDEGNNESERDDDKSESSNESEIDDDKSEDSNESESESDEDNEEENEVDEDEIMAELGDESATEEEEDDDDDDDDESRPPPLEPGLTLFIRNIPFEATEDELYKLFRSFGKLRYAKITMDYESQRSKGNGFVAFWKLEDARECLKLSNSIKLSTNSINLSKENPFTSSSILTADPTSKSAQRLTLQGRVLDVIEAINKDEATDKKEQGDKLRHQKDKRNAYLIREGVIFPNTPASKNLSPQDQERRTNSFNQRRRLLESNPSLYISKTRLSIRQLPLFVTDKVLKKLALYSIKQFEIEVSNGDREALSREELEDTTESSTLSTSSKTKGRLNAVIQSKVIRQTDKIDSSSGLGKSKGYGFLEVNNHKNALRCLRYSNNNQQLVKLMKDWYKEEVESNLNKLNETISKSKNNDQKKELITKKNKLDEHFKNVKENNLKDSRGTLIIEFSIENAQVVKRRADKAEAIKKRNIKRSNEAMEEENDMDDNDESERDEKKSSNKKRKTSKDSKGNKDNTKDDREPKSNLGHVIGRKRKERQKKRS